MLHLILGRAGTGKTEQLYQSLQMEVERGGTAIFLTPEQFSFETEKSLYRRLGAKGSQNVKVLSFTRLCYEIFRQYGGFGTELTPMHKQLLMAIALQEMQDDLQVYGGYKKNTSFITKMVDTVDDFKSAGLSGAQLREAASQCKETELGGKLQDMSLICETYNALIQQVGRDPKDNLKRAIQLASEQGYFKNQCVFIDSFMAFTPMEHRMLQIVLEQSKDVYGAFCCPGLQKVDGKTDVFAPVHKTISRLVTHCKSFQISIAAPKVCYQNYRTQNEALRAVEEQFCSEHISGEYGDGVRVFCGENPFSEVQYIGAEICRLVQEEGYRYNQISIISRNFSRYESVLPRVMEKYRIPIFMDRRVDIYTTPLIMGIKAVLDGLVFSLDTKHILQFAKSPMCQLTPLQAAMLENYCYIWSIKGVQLQKEFTANPQGQDSDFSEEAKEMLTEINVYRQLAIQPFIQFRSAMLEGEGSSFAQALFQLAMGFEPEERIRIMSEALPAEDKKSFLDLQGQVWDSFIELLDIFAQVVGKRKMSLQQYVELFYTMLSQCDVGQIPQTLDYVLVGMADRVRPDNVKAVFVMGCIEGEFPMTITPSGIFTKGEQQRITNLGIDMTADVEERSTYENHYAYFAVTRSSDRLYLSFPQRDLRGSLLTPSVLVNEVCAITGQKVIGLQNVDSSTLVWNEQTALEQLAEHYDKNSVFVATLQRFLQESAFGDRIKTMEQIRQSMAHTIQNSQTAVSLFGKDMTLSATALESFYNCKFSYFMKNGLRIRPLQRVELNPLEYGLVTHFIMERVLTQYADQLENMDTQQIREMLGGFITEYVTQRMPNEQLTPRLQYLFERIADSLTVVLEHLGRELSQTLFVPIGFEEKIAQNCRFQPLNLTTANGSKVTVEGYVDRIDEMVLEDKRYIRVVDYKSGAKKFQISEVAQGINMQMLIYLFSVCNDREENWIPAGVLYMPSKNTIVTVEEMQKDTLRKKKDETLKMNGLLLKERAVILGMEQGGEGLFVPAKVKGEEIDAKSSVVTMSQMSRLKELVEKKIVGMVEELHNGQIQADPLKLSDFLMCDYCQYKVACGRAETANCRRVETKGIADVLGGDKNE